MANAILAASLAQSAQTITSALANFLAHYAIPIYAVTAYALLAVSGIRQITSIHAALDTTPIIIIGAVYAAVVCVATMHKRFFLAVVYMVILSISMFWVRGA
jgi:hypothetical protein